jgi:hypothetical protein
MRKYLLLSLTLGTVAAIALAASWALRPDAAVASINEPAPDNSSPAATVPLTHVHLFSNGVGYFQRQGVVEGNTRIDLTFPVENLNDLLKSLVLQDLDGGRISVVGYDSHDPIDKTLRTFAINLADNPSYAMILTRARGEKVEIALLSGSQAATLTGTILGVEKQKQTVGNNALQEVDVLNLWCTDGMRSVKLADIQRLRFLNPTVEAEVKQALELLARGHDNQKKTVSLNFVGEGKRRVRIGYVIEHPLWKTSYRLMVDSNGTPRLQGWAVVDNPTDEEWKNVRLALVSGRPISYQMDLYTPIYVPRPKVELELFAGLRPPTHGAASDWMTVQREEMAKRVTVAEPGAPNKFTQPPVKAEAVGEFFQYVVEHPVSMPRQKSALFQILDREVEGKPVSIYSESNGIKHPMLGLHFKNSTGLHLTQGPVTVFTDGSYAGDARMPNLQPGEERLLSFAIDLGTHVEPQVSTPSETIFMVRIDKGILYATTKVREGKTYIVRNRSTHDRTLVIEHPFRVGFQLLSPAKYTARTDEVYRFEVHVPAGKEIPLEVVEERTIAQEVKLTDVDDQNVIRYLSSAAAGPELKEVLVRAREIKGKLQATRREIARTERQLKSIVDDQARLRANLERVPVGSDAYQRYLKKFDDQETEIEKLQDALKKLRATEIEQQQAYEDFLAHLSIG